MAKELKKIFERSSDEIVQGFTVQSWHVSQSVDALTGAEDYDITISGSLTVTGSVYLDGIEDADGSSVYNLVLNQSTGEVFTTASLSGGGGADGSSGTSGATGDTGTSGTSGTGGAGGDGTSGTSGDDGANGALIFPYQYNTSGIGTPPSGDYNIKSGLIIFNPTDSTGTTLTDFYDTVNDYGTPGNVSGNNKAILKLEKADDPTNFILYNVYNLQPPGNVAQASITTLVNPGYNFSDGDDILVSFNLIGVAGSDGSSGTSGAGSSGTGGDGTSGTSGATGDAGTSGTTGTSGNGSDGSSGTSGDDGSSGTSGTTGTSGNGTAGTSGTGGDGTAGTSGTGGAGSSGTSGTTGTSGNGTAGTSGTSGDGTSGTTGTSGNGTAGTSGTNGNGDNWTSTPTNPVSSGINVGDQHLNTSSGDVFSWTGTVWSTSGNIKGPSGSSGTSGDGTSGTSGEAGSSGTSGAGSTLTHTASTTSGSFINVPTQNNKLPSGWISVTISGQVFYIPAYYEDT